MPQIIVLADTPGEGGAAQVMFRERMTKRDFESGYFAAQLAERLGWAVGDTHAVDDREQAVRIQDAASAEDVSGSPAAASDEGVPTKTSQRRSARVVTTAS
jgi:hypothetical protein